MTLALTLVELILAVALVVVLMALQRARDPARRERLETIAARVTVPTIMVIIVLSLIVVLQDG
jgi:multisubunit Na+/H+ antiporter MnhB subunit